MKWFLRLIGIVAVALVATFFIFRVPDTDPAEMQAKYGSAPSQMVDIGDGRLVHLRDEGPRDAPVIVLLHGSNADLHTWQPWVDALSDDYRVVRFDQRGHGLTGPAGDGDYTLTAFGADIDAVTAALGVERFVLAGNSMGGAIAMGYALANPERLDGLVLIDASGAPILGYRAPSFSIDGRTPWAHEVLAEQGYVYSSSVAPIVHDHYGWREAPRFAFRPVEGSDLVEIPVTTAQIGERRLAAGGGGFFRVLPYAFSKWAIARVNERDVRPAIFYFHPWEIDPDQPRVAGAPVRSRLRHYTNLGKMAGKLRKLAGDFSWGRMDEIARIEAQRCVPFAP